MASDTIPAATPGPAEPPPTNTTSTAPATPSPSWLASLVTPVEPARPTGEFDLKPTTQTPPADGATTSPPGLTSADFHDAEAAAAKDPTGEKRKAQGSVWKALWLAVAQRVAKGGGTANKRLDVEKARAQAHQVKEARTTTTVSKSDGLAGRGGQGASGGGADKGKGGAAGKGPASADGKSGTGAGRGGAGSGGGRGPGGSGGAGSGGGKQPGSAGEPKTPKAPKDSSSAGAPKPAKDTSGKAAAGGTGASGSSGSAGKAGGGKAGEGKAADKKASEGKEGKSGGGKNAGAASSGGSGKQGADGKKGKDGAAGTSGKGTAAANPSDGGRIPLQKSRETGHGDGSKARRVVDHVRAYKDGVKDGWGDEKERNSREHERLDKAHDKHKAKAPDAPADQDTKGKASKTPKDQDGKPDNDKKKGPDQPKDDGPDVPCPTADEDDPMEDPFMSKPTPFQVEGIDADKITFGESIGDNSFKTHSASRGELRTFKQYETRLLGRVDGMAKVADATKSLAAEAREQADECRKLVEEAKGVEGGDKLIGELENLADDAKDQADEADEIHKKAVRAHDFGKSVLSNIQTRYKPLYQAVVDSDETKPGELKFYADRGIYPTDTALAA